VKCESYVHTNDTELHQFMHITWFKII